MLYTKAPTNTLGYLLKGRALSAHINRSTVPLKRAVQAIESSGLFNHHLARPEDDAVTFYLCNQAVSTIASRVDLMEPLSPCDLKIVTLYSQTASLIATRLFWYLLLITSREERHNQSPMGFDISPVVKDVQEVYPGVGDHTIEEMINFTRHMPDSEEILAKLSEDVADTFPLGPYCKVLSSLYYRCDWGGAFGGPKWGVIADALFNFVRGEWSAEILADTAFTLAHNTAPIFNKGMLYKENGGHLIELLDVQRAGAIPQWLSKDHVGNKWLNLEPVQIVVKEMPELFHGDVDWNRVEKLGAVGYYAGKPGYKHEKAPESFTPKLINVDAGLSVETTVRGMV